MTAPPPALPSELQALLAAGLEHHQAGRLAEASAHYSRVLEAHPGYPEALYFSGVLSHQAGDNATAIKSITEAIKADSNNANYHSDLGTILCKDGRDKEAVTSLRKAVALDPGLAAAHSNLGAALHGLGRHEASAQACRKALEIDPSEPEAHSNLGNALNKLGQWEEALEHQRKAVELRPAMPELHYNMGNTCFAMEHHGDAEGCFRQVLSLSPDHADAHYMLGRVLDRLGKPGEARSCLEKAIDLRPDDAKAETALGVIELEAGNLDTAIGKFRSALARQPDYAEAIFYMGRAHLERLELDQAKRCFEDVLKMDRTNVHALMFLGNAYRHEGRLDEAERRYRAVLKHNPNSTEATANLAAIYTNRGEHSKGQDGFRAALDLQADHPQAYSNYLMTLYYDPGMTQAWILEESRAWEETFLPLAAPAVEHTNTPEPDRRLKVGYVSGDFRQHSVGYFCEAPLEAHDRNGFEVFCYSTSALSDQRTDRLKGLADHWRLLAGESDDDCARIFREDAIDILVDLSGHTAHNRLRSFLSRPAPVQVSCIGFPGTTGLDSMGYRLTDSLADPEGLDDEHYTERLVRLPRSFLCYTPPADAPPIAETPRASKDYVTFGSFNSTAKTSGDVVAAWAEILNRVAGSKLLLKCAWFADAKTRKRFTRMFSEFGIAADRLDLRPATRLPSEHLGIYAEVDIALDTFPYNGATTTCEALWMGVPVVALRGDRHAGRVGASLLTNTGLEDLLADDTGSYVETAVTLAHDVDRLTELRAGMRDRFRDSPVMDAPGYVRALEDAYRGMWHDWCHGRDRG